jgi:UDP-N-acetylmuramyl pentapeptide phosphotransferase/UDP-N-acetylglucosamine-1-phosphate transferase
VTVAFGLIGFADDWAKVSRNDNKGVSGRVRLGLGFVIAAIADLVAVGIHPRAVGATGGSGLQGRAAQHGLASSCPSP